MVRFWLDLNTIVTKIKLGLTIQAPMMDGSGLDLLLSLAHYQPCMPQSDQGRRKPGPLPSVSGRPSPMTTLIQIPAQSRVDIFQQCQPSPRENSCSEEAREANCLKILRPRLIFSFESGIEIASQWQERILLEPSQFLAHENLKVDHLMYDQIFYLDLHVLKYSKCRTSTELKAS